jgi:hypothetical protein
VSNGEEQSTYGFPLDAPENDVGDQAIMNWIKTNYPDKDPYSLISHFIGLYENERLGALYSFFQENGLPRPRFLGDTTMSNGG